MFHVKHPYARLNFYKNIQMLTKSLTKPAFDRLSLLLTAAISIDLLPLLCLCLYSSMPLCLRACPPRLHAMCLRPPAPSMPCTCALRLCAYARARARSAPCARMVLMLVRCVRPCWCLHSAFCASACWRPCLKPAPAPCFTPTR